MRIFVFALKILSRFAVIFFLFAIGRPLLGKLAAFATRLLLKPSDRTGEWPGLLLFAIGQPKQALAETALAFER
jgi:hypothetical protein